MQRNIISSESIVGSGHGFALIYAFACVGHVSGVSSLLENGADIEARDDCEFSVLWHAITSESVSLVRFLLEKGANVESSNRHGRSALHVAVDVGCESIVWLLLESGANINAYERFRGTALREFAYKGDCN